jgi:hypothetical protein
MSKRAAVVVVALLGLAGTWACWCDLGVIWDGAYQFCFTLAEQRPYQYETRFHSAILWQPLLWLSWWCRDLRVLRFAFAFPFCLAPAFGFAASWWMVRREAPRLALWAVFGIAAATLPGQAFVINDTIFQLHVFWPVFLGLMMPLNPAQRIAVILLSLFQLSHQIGTVLCGASALSLLLIAHWTTLPVRRRYLWRSLAMACLCMAGIAKIFAFPDSYAAREFSWRAARICWQQGVAGWPLFGWLLMAAGGVLTFRVPRAAEGVQLRMHRLAIACVLAGGLLWVYWAGEPYRWAKALDYRRFAVPLSAPFFILAWMECRDAIHGRGTMDQDGRRETMALVLGGVFIAVLGLQAAQWRQLQRRLTQEVGQRSSVVVPMATLPWIRNTPLDHWSATALVIAHGTSDKLLLDPSGLEVWNGEPPRVPLTFFQSYPVEAGPNGWFDFRAAARRWRAEKMREDGPR